MKLTRLLLHINQRINDHAKKFTFPYITFAIFGIITYPFYFYLWRITSPQGYENLELRLIAVFLCILLAMHEHWPTRLRVYLPIFWYITILYSLPFLFTFLILKNQSSYLWAMNGLTVLILSILILDLPALFIILALGIALGMGLFLMTGGILHLYPDTMTIIMTYGSVLLFGSVFSYRKDQIKEREMRITAETANQAKSEFIANMSHDIRTPLSGILGLIDGMINTAINIQSTTQRELSGELQLGEKYLLVMNQLKKLIHTVEEDGQLLLGAADELLQLLNEILDTMTLESGKIPKEAESFNLSELLEHNIELMLPIARHKKIELSYEIDKVVPTYFYGLRHYLDRTLLNLLSNALKFTKKGFVSLKVQLFDKNPLSTGLGDKIKLKISVEDSGIGIPKDKFETIFEHFSRLTPSYQGLYKGAGLGLYTVKHYIKAMNAEISVESEVGVGTCFLITIPLIVSDHADREKLSYRIPKTHSANHYQPQPIPVTSKADKLAKTKDVASILLVEDNQIAARAVIAIIQHLNKDCQCEVATDGKEALKMVQESDYDLIIMDIGLPDIDGIEVTRQIRHLKNRKKAQVPIIALTGHASNFDKREQALSAGMQEIFTKPLAPVTLESLLYRYIFNKEQIHTQMKRGASISEAENSLRIINWQQSLRQHDNNKELICELLLDLADDLKELQKKLLKSNTTDDGDALRAELHRVRGGVVYLNLPQLEDALTKFHDAIKEKPCNIARLQKTKESLQNSINDFLDWLDEEGIFR